MEKSTGTDPKNHTKAGQKFFQDSIYPKPSFTLSRILACFCWGMGWSSLAPSKAYNNVISKEDRKLLREIRNKNYESVSSGRSSNYSADASF